MWKIIGTVVIGGVVIVLYKVVSYITENCYLYQPFNKPFKQTQFNVVMNFRQCINAVLRVMNRRHHKLSVVGMDCEMTSTSVDGGHPVPAILQLANPDGYCAIFQLKVMEKIQEKIVVPYLSDTAKLFKYRLPSENILMHLLEDSRVLKVGVAVVNDAQYLEESYGMICKGCLDVRFLARRAGIEPKGLDYLAKKVLGKEKVEISKKNKKPWESKELNLSQIQYALRDAQLGVEIFLKLNEIVIERNYSWWRRLFWDEKTYWKYTLKLWKDYIGKNFQFSAEAYHFREDWISYIERNYFCKMASTLGGILRYQNTVLESSLGGRSCFVCGYPDVGGSRNVQLKSMVPVDYIVQFEDPDLYYICLCKDCLEDCRIKVDYEMRYELTEECGAPFPDYEDHRLIKAKKIAEQLLFSGKNNSEKEWTKILEFNLQKVFPHLENEHLNGKTMEIILSMDCWPESDHGRFVHDYFTLYGGGLDELRWRWCERFWRKMRPKNLPWKWKDFYRQDRRWHWIMT